MSQQNVPLRLPAPQEAWRLAGTERTQELFVSLRCNRADNISTAAALWTFCLYVPSQGKRVASSWVTPSGQKVLGPAQLRQIGSLLAYMLPKEAEAYGSFLLKRALGEHSVSGTAFQALAAFLGAPELNVRPVPASAAEMQEMFLCTQPEPTWENETASPPLPKTENALDDLMTVGMLVEDFLRDLLHAQVHATTPEACGQECAALCENMTRIFSGHDAHYPPAPSWSGQKLAEAMTQNGFLSVPSRPTPDETMTTFFMAAGLQALELFQAHAESELSDRVFQEKFDQFRRGLTLFLSGHGRERDGKKHPPQ